MPVYGRTSLAEGIEFQMRGRRIISTVLGALALLGLALAAVGLYGLIAETVIDRKREFAIRIAVGADPGGLLFAVLRRTVLLASLGVVAGLMLSAALSYAIRGQLFGVTTGDPLAYMSAAGVLVAVAVLAGLAPAIRATGINPVDVLRGD
jgi:ABC-type antimicrobial peptide transport system permease subunit